MKKIEIEIPYGYEFDKETMSIVPVKDNMEYIDLGLPSGTLWASCNVGATKPEEHGGHFTFDEAQRYNCPSKEQFEELIKNCSWILCTINQTNGYIVVGKNGNHIFFPAAGYCGDPGLSSVGSYGGYWSSSFLTDGSYYVWYLGFNLYNHTMYYDCRYYSLSVRPIKNP